MVIIDMTVTGSGKTDIYSQKRYRVINHSQASDQGKVISSPCRYQVSIWKGELTSGNIITIGQRGPCKHGRACTQFLVCKNCAGTSCILLCRCRWIISCISRWKFAGLGLSVGETHFFHVLSLCTRFIIPKILLFSIYDNINLVL